MALDIRFFWLLLDTRLQLCIRLLVLAFADWSMYILAEVDVNPIFAFYSFYRYNNEVLSKFYFLFYNIDDALSLLPPNLAHTYEGEGASPPRLFIPSIFS